MAFCMIRSPHESALNILRRAFTEEMSSSAFQMVGLKMLTTDSPTKLGLIWGIIIATWWMGAGLSISIMASARIGSYPKLRMKDLIKPTALALCAMGLYGLKEGFKGYRLAKSGSLRLDQEAWRAWGTPDESMIGFITDSFAHVAAYKSGVYAAVGLTVWTLYKRYKKRYKLRGTS